MNWISNVVRPKIRNYFARRDTPENLWIKCPETGQLVFYKDVEANQFVIPGSNYHMRMGATARLKSIFDNETWFDVAIPAVPLDPLKFRDERRYTDRLKDARAKTGTNDAIKLGYGKLEGLPVVIGVQDFDFMGGSLGMAAGEAVIKGLETAVDKGRRSSCSPPRAARACGGHSCADAAAAHDRGGADVARGEEALHRRAHQSDHRRGHGILCHARRRPHRRARCADRLCRPARDRADHPREAARGLSARRISQDHGMVDMVVPRTQLRPMLANLCRLLTRAPAKPPTGICRWWRKRRRKSAFGPLQRLPYEPNTVLPISTGKGYDIAVRLPQA
jgi:acetyl-CoA carboxylase carboxyl transferase subunit beta